jgi:hypothetical protein
MEMTTLMFDISTSSFFGQHKKVISAISSVNRRSTDQKMAKRKRTKGHTTIYKTYT